MHDKYFPFIFIFDSLIWNSTNKTAKKKNKKKKHWNFPSKAFLSSFFQLQKQGKFQPWHAEYLHVVLSLAHTNMHTPKQAKNTISIFDSISF